MDNVKNVIRLNNDILNELESYRAILRNRYRDKVNMIDLLTTSQLIKLAVGDAIVYLRDY